MSLISVVTPCYNEEENVEEVYKQVKSVFEKLKKYSYEHIFIDNASKDRTVQILKEIARKDKNVKIIVNSRNFGHIRSPYYALLLTKGDASAFVAADLQDPPAMICEFLKKWEEGYKIIISIKKNSEESKFMFAVRKLYYNIAKRLSEGNLVQNFNGFGLYDKKVIEILRKIDDPYPYFRGLICDIGFERAEIEYIQSKRKRGATKNNFYVLYDLAMLGITNHSKIPLRIATIIGFTLAFLNVVIAFFYFLYKILFWSRFSMGIAPLVIGLFFFSSVQLFFVGVIGEYLGAVYTQVLKRPLVIEKERINFDVDEQV